MYFVTALKNSIHVYGMEYCHVEKGALAFLTSKTIMDTSKTGKCQEISSRTSESV